MSKLHQALDNIYNNTTQGAGDLAYLLSCNDPAGLQSIFSYADKIRRRFMGDGVLLRGLIEFSNYCDNSCFYCGLNNGNSSLRRYRMSEKDIFDCVASLYSLGIKTVVLQSGEDRRMQAGWLEGVIKKIKDSSGIAVTLSVGERSPEDYRLWKEAGADRYLLRIETTDKALYESMHKGRTLDSRLRCLKYLRDAGYQVGSGIMVGLKGQTVESIAEDILFFRENDFDMVGIGPFIPHPDTCFSAEERGNILMTLKVIALTRIVTRNAHLPATTALGSLEKDYRFEGLSCGANVLMPNFTPFALKPLYEIYPGKRCLDEDYRECIPCMELMAGAVGRNLDYSIGHSLKINNGG